MLSAPFPILSGGRQPVTLGEKIKYQRIQRNLFQRELAALLGVDKASIENWEQDRAAPNLRAWPALIEFLGYDPRPAGGTMGEQLKLRRQELGLSTADLAQRWDIDPATVSTYETKADCLQNHLSIPRIVGVLGYNPLPPPETPGQYIRQVRYLAGLKQTRLGAMIRVCNDTVSKWELDQSTPSPTQLDSIESISRRLEPPFPLPCPNRIREIVETATRQDRRFNPRSAYPAELKTLGDRIRKRRLDLGLSQAALAEQFGVNKTTVSTWEKGFRQPDLSRMDRIVEFLGEDAVPTDGPLAERMRAKRRALGLKQAEFANLFGVCTKTMHYWETGTRIPSPELIKRIRAVLRRPIRSFVKELKDS